MRIQRRRLLSVGLIGVFILCLCGCESQSKGLVSGKGYASSNVATTEADSGTEAEETTNLYMVTAVDMNMGTIMVTNIDSGRDEQYSYTDGTYFLDKYGNHTPLTDITPGKIVTLSLRDKNLKLETIQISDEAWEYDNVVKFGVDEENGVFSIANSKYSYDSSLAVFSDDKRMELSELSSQDILRVQGIDKKILSISVTTGHGFIQLQNTSDLEGGWLSLNQNRYYEITENMNIEVPEGDYTLSVAGNGYGGTTDIVVNRGEETAVNVDDIKGDGPQYCTITFAVDVENASVYVDGTPLDISQSQQIRYGVHRLKIVADWYDTWSKLLFVHSTEAFIEVTLTETSEDTESTEAATDTTSSTETSTESSTTDSSTTDSYLNTLSQIIDSLTGTSSD